MSCETRPRELVEAAELMTSELATNCVRHAHSDFELTIHDSRHEIRVEVSDSGQGQPTLRSPTPQEHSGRGLLIVEELSTSWGTIPSANGKLVWFTLPQDTPASERALSPHPGRPWEREPAGASIYDSRSARSWLTRRRRAPRCP